MKKLCGWALCLLWSCAAGARTPVIHCPLPSSDSLLWDLSALSRVPSVQWTVDTGRVHALIMRSVSYKGHPTEVFAYYSDPDLLLKRKQKGRYPAVLLLHGGAGAAFRQWVEKWAADGYAALAIDLSGRGMDHQPLPNGGPDLENNDNVFGTVERGNLYEAWTYQAVAKAIAAHSLLLSMKHVDPQRTCLTGISWGGYLTCIVGSIDNRFRAAAPVYGSGYYTELPFFAGMKLLSEEGRQRWMRWFDPSHYLPYASIPFLFVSGNADTAYQLYAYKKSYELIDASQRTICIRPGMQHGYYEGWEPFEIKAYFESVLNGGCPLAKVYPARVDNQTIRVEMDAPVTPQWAQFYYTNDTECPNTERRWSSVTMQEVRTGDRSVFTTPIPDGGYRIGCVVMRDNRGFLTSTGFILND